VLLSTWGSRGDVEPLAGLALRLRELGAEVRVCAPPDEEFVELLDRVGVPLIPLGASVGSVVRGERKVEIFPFAAELVAARFETLGKAAEGCDVLLATGLMPAGARDVAEKLGLRYVYACFHPFEQPSPNYSPSPWRPGTPTPPEVTDNQALWEWDAKRVNELYAEPLNRHRAAIGLPPVANVRDHVFTDQPWLAADPVLGPWQGQTRADLVQTGAWILPDIRPLPADLAEFLDAGEPPVYVGFGSMAMAAVPDLGQIVVEAIRARGRRALIGRGWADLAAIDDVGDCFVVGEVNQQALFPRVAAVVHHGGVGTTTTTARAGAPQVIVPQIVDQPYWARRVAELGIGAAHDGAKPTVESLSAALATALAPETAAQAKSVAAWISTDGTAVAAKMLLDR
jgi:vancomycin aglycone glucosyltransferase